MFYNFRQCYQVMKDHSKIANIHFWMIQKPKNDVLAIFLSLVCWIDLIWHIVLVLNVFQHLPTLPCHDISFKNDTGHDIMQKSQECVFEWSKVPCKRLLTIFCNLFCWIDLLLNFWIVCHLAIWPCCHVFVQVGQFDMLKMLTWRWAGHSKWRYSSQRQLRLGS